MSVPYYFGSCVPTNYYMFSVFTPIIAPGASVKNSLLSALHNYAGWKGVAYPFGDEYTYI
jgi:hypothetical protein